jgi:hypothetical protein
MCHLGGGSTPVCLNIDSGFAVQLLLWFRELRGGGGDASASFLA